MRKLLHLSTGSVDASEDFKLYYLCAMLLEWRHATFFLRTSRVYLR